MSAESVAHPQLNSRVAADAVKFIHLSLIALITIGWASPWIGVWITIAILVPGLQLHWMTNKNVCVLTTIELKLRGHRASGDENQELFLRILFKSLFNWEPTRSQITLIVYATIYFSFSVCVVRIWLSAA